MTFEEAYKQFMEKHKKARRGERLRRLTDGHGHGEKMLLENVWWPAFRNLENLHPEYEVSDFKDGARFLDYAFMLDFMCWILKLMAIDPMRKKSVVPNSRTTS